MTTQRFRATVVFEYAADTDDVHETYGTNDPVKMAQVDRDQAMDDLGLFISLAANDQYDVKVEPIDG